MAAMPASAWPSADADAANVGPIETTAADPTRSPAGVVPLLQALGRTMADHTRAGYATLQKDDRFWTLIRLLQVLGGPERDEALGAESGEALESGTEEARKEP